MNSPGFDTHHFVKKLTDAGLPLAQAEAHVEAMRDALAPLSARALNKLDNADYENIYLQVRNRGWRWLIAVGGPVLGALVATIGLTSFFALKSAITKSVDRYVSTEAFKTQVLTTTLSRLTSIDERMAKAQQGAQEVEKRIGALAALPLTVSENGFSVVDKAGRTLYIESGRVKDGEKIVFKSPFKSRPTFFLQVSGEVLKEGEDLLVSAYRTQKRVEQFQYGLPGRPNLFMFLDDGRSGVQVRKERIPVTYEWLAIGQ